MKLKNMWKRFWTLDVHNHEGFTLVELIIVIAILAILSTGAIAGYSAYVEKANITADKALASEIANVLTLHAYSNGMGTGGYVVLSADDGKAVAAGEDVIKALEAAYGKGSWETALKLKYSGWSDDGVLDTVVGQSADTIKNLAHSPFFQKSTPSGLVDAISSMTDGLAGMAQTASQDPMNTMQTLGVISPQQFEDIKSELKDLNVSWSTEVGADNTAYSTALSNIIVKHVANETGNVDISVNPDLDGVSQLGQFVFLYSAIYASAANGSAECKQFMEEMEKLVKDPNTSADQIIGKFDNAPEIGDTSEADMSAVATLMGSVADLSKDFDMTKSGLYSSDSITGIVNDYASAVTSLSGLTAEQISFLKTLSGNEVVIFVTGDGVVSIVPMDVKTA